MGEGSNVRSRGRGGKDSHSITLTGWLSRRPWPRRRYGEPEKISVTSGAGPRAVGTERGRWSE